MKKIMGWSIISVFVLAASQVSAQTNTNVDFATLRLQIALRCFTNSDTGGTFNESGALRINSKDIIQTLSGRLAFPLGKILDGDGTPIPHRGAAVMSNYTSNAKLLLIQALGTNHGIAYVVVRDGRPPIDYDVSDYFTFTKRGFEASVTNRVTGSSGNPTNPDTTSVYVEDITFDNLATSGGGDRVAFHVDGFTKERRGAVKVKGAIVDSDATKTLHGDVAGTGSISNNFSVIRGTIDASGPTHETK